MKANDRFAEELTRLGLSDGDCVLVRASLKALGDIRNPAAELIAGILRTVGARGTVVALTHSGVFQKGSAPENIFTKQSAAITGGFANALLQYHGALRSAHPTHSIAAIGRDAELITKRHDEGATPFGFIRTLLDVQAKMILIGCTETSPGFSTVHYAFESDELRHSNKIRRSRKGSWYIDSHESIKWYKQEIDPGCSRGFGNFYKAYSDNNALLTGVVGDAYSMSISVNNAYSIELKLLNENPRFGLCNDLLCRSCRWSRKYNKRDRPKFIINASKHLLSTRIFR